ALNKARLFQALAEGTQTLRVSVWRCGVKNPITGIADCCARAAIGHNTAAPSSVMNSRRLARNSIRKRFGINDPPVSSTRVRSAPMATHSITSSARCWSSAGHVEAECLRSLEIDRQREFDRGLDGKVGWLRALKDTIGIDRCAPKIINLVIPVGQQAAKFSEVTERIHRRKTVASG